MLRSPGQPLDAATRDFMGSRFGHDFSAVRVHTGATAAESARSVGASAYTAGRDVVFGPGEYAPHTRSGRSLIAHELTHVVQQRGQAAESPRELGPTDDRYEREADSAARDISADAEPHSFLSATSGRTIQRQALGEDELADVDIEVESDDTEAHDGDSPVSGSDVAALDDETSAEFDMMAQLGDIAQQESIPTQAGGGAKQKDKPKDKKAVKRTVTEIDVDQAAQSMTVTWSDGTVETHAVSTGRGEANTVDDPCKKQTEKNCTPNDTFKVSSKRGGDAKNKEGAAMSWFIGFADPNRGIGIHDSQPVPGHPASHGCVRVGNTPEDDAFAKKINQGSVIGQTIIRVHGKAATKPYTKKTTTKSKEKRK